MHISSFFVAVALAGVVVPFASAQEGQWSIVERLPLNTRIDVERATQVRISGERTTPVRISGEFERATTDELFLRVDDRITPVLRSDIRRVQMRVGHHAGSGAKWGFLAGAGVGAIVGVAQMQGGSDPLEAKLAAIGYTLTFSGAGAVTGALLGWAVPRRETIYQDTVSTSFHVSPVVTGGKRGVRLAFVFD